MAATPYHRRPARALWGLIALALACSGNGNPTNPETPAISVSITPTSGTIELGGSVEVAVTVTGSGNFSGPATVSLSSAPSGVTGTVSNSQTSGGNTTATLTIEVGAGAALGAHTLTVQATGAGVAAATTTFALTVLPLPAYSISLNPEAATIEQSSSGTVDVTLARTNFAEPVTLALEDAPAGVSGSFSVNPATADASVLSLVVDAATVGDHTLTVRGTATGLADETAMLTLTVAEPSEFSLDPPASISIEQGSSGVRTVTITRGGGFTGDVTVTVTDLPTGITATVDPATTGGTSVDVTVNVAGTVAVGSYGVTVRGNAAGQPEATQTLDVEVLASTSEVVTLDFSVCVPEERPTWLAYQDGSGPWTPVAGASDVYTFNVGSATAALAATITPQAGESSVLVYYATQAEMVSANIQEFCDLSVSGKTVGAAVAGIDPVAGEGVSLTLGDAYAETNANGPVSFTGVPDGNLDLVGYLWSFTASPNRMVVQRDLNPASGADLGTIDFDGAGSFTPGTADITLQGGSGAGGFWFMEYATSPSPGTCFYAPLDDASYMGSPFTVPGAPGGEREVGDFHVVTAVDSVFTVSETFATLANRTISFGAPLPTPTITDITGGAVYRRLRAQLSLPSEYNSTATFSLGDASGQRSIAAIATADWMGGASITLEIPDLGGVAGWDDIWAPSASATTNWGVLGYGFSGDTCTEGAREVTAVTAGSVG